MTSNKQLRSESKRLHKVWFAGVNPNEFTRVMKVQEVEQFSIPLLCDEVRQAIRSVERSKTQQLRMWFQELYYITYGIFVLFKAQVTFLYEQVVQQAKSSLDFVQQSRTIIFEKSTKTLPKNEKRSRNDSDIDFRPSKRVKFIVNAEFDWRDLNDIEVDDESTIQILQKSKIMNRDQISLRDVMDEPEQDPIFDTEGFDAAENASTQKFLEIREFVANNRSIMQIIQNESFNPIPLTVNHESEYGEYGPLSYQQDDSLPDNEPYQQELEMDAMPCNVDNTITNHEAPDISSRLDVPSFLQNDFQNNLPILTKRAVKGKKRKRRVIDISTQHPINIEDDKKLYRCKSARLDCINKRDLLHHSRTRIFNKPLHMLKDLKPRYFKDTPALMVGLQRAKRRKRQEQTDQTLLNDFLNAINDPPQEDDSISSTIAEQFQPYHEKIPQRVEQQPQHEPQDEPYFDHLHEPQYELQYDHQDEPQNDHQDELQYDHQDEPQNDHQDEPMQIESDFEEPMDFSEPRYESNSRITEKRKLNEHEEVSSVVRNEIQNTYQREEVLIPRNVLRILNEFVAVEFNERPSYGSQTLFILKNQKNRDKWGLKGVLQNLLRLWNSNIHPIGMKELMYPHKEKLAAALAFYSIMELNSPRIGLILIEKYENSNTVYHIKKSPKLIKLLQRL